jgi:hypothetical protein
VQSGRVASGEQAIQGNGGGLNDGSFVWPNLGYTPAENERVRIQVDMARTLSATVADSSPVYAVDIYDFDFNRTSRFGLQQRDGVIRTFVSVPINDLGEIDPDGEGIRPEFYGTSIAENVFVHFDFWMDYVTKTVSLTVDGERLASLVPFRTKASETLDSAELQVGTFNNLSADVGYFDNYAVSVVLKGDYDANGFVDAADYTIWRDNFDSTTNLSADGDGNGTVDVGDYEVWSTHFGQSQALSSGAGSLQNAAVPEPSSMVMLSVGLGALLVRRVNR